MASSRRHALITLGAALLAPAARADDAALVIEPLRTGLFLIRGGGANSLLRLSANGLLLVNGKSPDSYPALMKAIRRINKLADQPLRALLLTDPAQAGDNARFAAAHVATVVQANGAPRIAAGAVAFDRDYTVRLGGVEARLLHFGPARSDADVVVWFPDKRVVAIGELAADPNAPATSLAGWRDTLAEVLALDADLYVPGSGPPIDRIALQAFQQTLMRPA